MIFEIMETFVILTGCVNVIGNIIVLLGLVLSGQATPTRIFLGYIATLSMIQQFVSPAFHKLYTSNFYDEFDVRQLLTLSFCFVLIGIIVALLLLLLMDYFENIKNYKIIVLIVHFALIMLIILLLHLVINSRRSEDLIFICIMGIAFSFGLFFISHGYLECLKTRKQTDDESTTRLMFVTVYIGSKLFAGILLAFDVLIHIASWSFGSRYPVGALPLGVFQLESIFFLAVLFKFDQKFKNSFISLRRFPFKKSIHTQFENLV